MDNTGGRTFILLFWQPVREGTGPFLLIEDWPPDDTEISWHLWPPVDLPDLRWSFEVVQRHYPRGHAQHFMDHWLILRGPNGLRLWTWFRADTFGGNLATVYWYPESQGDGPYLQIGRTKAALIDLRRGRTFRLLHSPTNNWPKYPMRPDGFAIQPDEEVADTFVVLKGEPDRFLALWRDGSERVLDPLPAIVKPGKGRHLGKVDIRRMTFTPAAGK